MNILKIKPGHIFCSTCRYLLLAVIMTAVLISTTIRSHSAELHLTAEEKDYLNNMDHIAVAAIDNFAPFNFINNGVQSGYSVEYMKLIADALEKDIRFYQAPWSSLLEMLKNGQIHVIPHIAVTEERKHFVTYTDFNHITYTTGFTVRRGDNVASMDDLKGKTVAVAKKTFLHTYLAKNFPEIPLLLVKSTFDALEALAQDKVFAVIGSLPTLSYYIQDEWRSNLKVVSVGDLGLPAKTSLPMGVRKGDLIFKSILEKANSALSQDEVNTLKKKWVFNVSNEPEDYTLSLKEQTFLQKNKVIRFRIRSNRHPFEFSENGKAAGIAVEYIQEIAKKIGFTAKFVINDLPLDDSFNMINGTRELFDTFAFSVKSDERARRFSFGDEFISYPMMIIANKSADYIGKTSDLNGKYVAIEKGFLTNNWLMRDYPAIHIVSAENTVDALKMVNDGKVDAYIGNIAVANYMMTHGNLHNIKVVAPSGYGTIKYSFIAPKDWPELASILSKGYRTLPEEFHRTIQQKWFTIQVVEHIDYKLLWQILAGVSFFIVWILWWNRKLMTAKRQADNAMAELQKAQLMLKEQNEKLEQLSITDRLTGLFNRLKLDSVLNDELERAIRYRTPFGVILMDIDHFKSVNDTFGHQTGDDVLKAIAEILLTNIRKVDTAGRWGGEEFLIICPQSDMQGLVQLAETLRIKIEANEFKTAGRLTASFGVASYDGDDSVKTIMSRADKALYCSKESGRNKVTN